MMHNKAVNMMIPWLGSFIQEQGFSVVDLRDSDSFGNSIAIFQSQNIRLRAIIDKNQFYIEIGSAKEPELWYDLNLISSLLKGNSTEFILDPKYQVNFLIKNFPDIILLFNVENFPVTKKKLNTLAKKRMMEMFPHAFKPPTKR